MKRAIIYARVSTDEQADKGYSLPSQIEACRKYAEMHGYHVIAEFQDEGRSGATLDRPNLERLRVMLNERKADVVIVFDPDRLSRDDVDFLILCREMERAGVAIHFVNGGEVPNTPDGDIVRYLMGWRGKRERKQIIERTLRGKRAKAKAGKWVGAARPPYGYRRELNGRDVHLVIDEQQAAIIRQIFDWYVGDLKNPPLNLRQVMELLAKIPPPKAGRGWHVETIKRLIDRRAYIGEFQWDGVKIPLPDLAIIDRETWDAAQIRRKRNKEFAKRNRKQEYLLAGHIKCKCEGAIIGNTSRFHHKGKTYFSLRYVCPFEYRATRRAFRPCQEKPFSAARADTIVWEWVVSLISDPEKLKKGLREYANARESELQRKRERLATLDELIEKAEKKVNRLAAAFANETDETVGAALREQMKIAGREYEGLASERERVTAEIQDREISEREIESVMRLAVEIEKRLNPEPSFEQKRALLDTLDVRCNLREDEMGRWLDCTCGLKVQPTPLPLCVTDLTTNVGV